MSVKRRTCVASEGGAVVDSANRWDDGERHADRRVVAGACPPGTTLYALGPETMRRTLTDVDAPKSLTSRFYEVTQTIPWSSVTYTAAHVHDHVAFIRDDLFPEAPIIEEQVTSGKIALTARTAQVAHQLAQLAGRPA